MKHIFVFAAFLCMATAFAQKQKSGTTGKPGILVRYYPVSWGSNGDTGRQHTVSLEQFRELLSQKLVVRTKGWQIERFEFTYGERGIYEDSLGNPLMLTDYMTQLCKGDSLPGVVYSYLPSHAKAGDTAYFNNIVVSNPAGVRAFGTPFRVVLQR